MEWYFILLIVILGVVILYITSCIILYNILLRKPRFNEDNAVMSSDEMKLLKSKIEEAEDYLKDKARSDEYITVDNLKLHGVFYDQHSDRSVIIVHGYCAKLYYRLMDVPYYYKKGYNVLLIDLRAHGESEGKDITLGALESKDTIEWAKWLSKRTNNSKIILDGVSMGAATVLNCSGNPDLPNNVVGIVADCSYTSPMDISRHIIKRTFKIPGKLSTQIAKRYAKAFHHYDMSIDSPINNIKKAKIPALIIHGDKDDFVPFSMSQDIYDNYAGPKMRLITKDTGHALSTVKCTKECQQALDEFLTKVIPN